MGAGFEPIVGVGESGRSRSPCYGALSSQPALLRTPAIPCYLCSKLRCPLLNLPTSQQVYVYAIVGRDFYKQVRCGVPNRSASACAALADQERRACLKASQPRAAAHAAFLGLLPRGKPPRWFKAPLHCRSRPHPHSQLPCCGTPLPPMQFRVWIISFTKVARVRAASLQHGWTRAGGHCITLAQQAELTPNPQPRLHTQTVFAMHPPGEHLHLESLAHATADATLPAWRLLLTLANGMRLPYMVVTGCGWATFAFNIPMQVGDTGPAAWLVGQGASTMLCMHGIRSKACRALACGEGAGALCALQSATNRTSAHRPRPLLLVMSSWAWHLLGPTLNSTHPPTQRAPPPQQVLLTVYSWAGRGGKLPLLSTEGAMQSSIAFAEANLASEL